MVQIASLDPILSRTPLPVNQAIAKALEKYALVFQFNSSSDYFAPPESVSHFNDPDLTEGNIKGNPRSEN